MPGPPVIVCAVDFSEHSRLALRYGVRVAEHFRATLLAVNVIDPLLVAAAQARRLEVVPDVQRELSAFVASSVPALDDKVGAVKTVVAVGDAPDELVRIADEANADLIVLGTHGVTGYQRLVLGSVTAQVLRRTDRPVLAIPPTDEDPMLPSAQLPALLNCILVPVDFSEESKQAARVGAALAQSLGARLVLAHAVPPIHGLARWREDVKAQEQRAARAAADQMKALAAPLASMREPDLDVRVGRPADVITAIAGDRHARFIVMALRGMGGLLDPRPGSLAYRVLSQTSAPMLALPPEGALSWLS
jgi:nucleotide-binding universal stress UspA family protein